MSIVISDQETVSLVRRLADATGETPEAAITRAVRAQLEAEAPQAPSQPARDAADFHAAIRKIQEAVAKLPVHDPHFTEDSLYDEFGLPK